MSVYKRKYHQYEGPFTPTWSRFLVLPNYAFANVFRSRWMVAFLVFCFVPVLVYGALIYLRYNATFLDTAGLRVSDFVAIDAGFFEGFLISQLGLSWVLAAFVGPGLISPDLQSGALPLYFCRPFSRTEYLLGKGSVLAVLISAITWVPGLALIGMQVAYGGLGWLQENPRIPLAMMATCWLWIIILTLVSLALSAWVRWRMVAGAMIFGVFFVLSAFSAVANTMWGTYWATLLDTITLFVIISAYLFEGIQLPGTVPVGFAAAWMVLIMLACLWILNRRVQAYEVVR